MTDVRWRIRAWVRALTCVGHTCVWVRALTCILTHWRVRTDDDNKSLVMQEDAVRSPHQTKRRMARVACRRLHVPCMSAARRLLHLHIAHRVLRPRHVQRSVLHNTADCAE